MLAALGSALTTFLVLFNLTPIFPTHSVVVWVLGINGVLILPLIGIVAWHARRLVRERRARAAASGLHVRIVGLFSLIAVLPAILVAVVASVIMERSLDPWFNGTMKELMNNSVEIARSYRETQCRTIARETLLMAADLNRAKVLFDADRNVFREFFKSRAVFLGFPLAEILNPDGTVVEKIESKPLEGVPPPTAADLANAVETNADCTYPATGNVFRSLLRLQGHDGRLLYLAREVDPRAIQFPQIAEEGLRIYAS